MDILAPASNVVDWLDRSPITIAETVIEVVAGSGALNAVGYTVPVGKRAALYAVSVQASAASVATTTTITGALLITSGLDSFTIANISFDGAVSVAAQMQQFPLQGYLAAGDTVEAQTTVVIGASPQAQLRIAVFALEFDA